MWQLLDGCWVTSKIKLGLLAVFSGYVNEEHGDLHGGEVTLAVVVVSPAMHGGPCCLGVAENDGY